MTMHGMTMIATAIALSVGATKVAEARGQPPVNGEGQVSQGGAPLPQEGTPMPGEIPPPPEGTTPSPEGTAPLPEGTAPSPEGTAPSPEGATPLTTEEELPSTSETVPAAPVTPAYAADTGVTPLATPRWAPASRLGMSVMGGGGVTNFTSNVASDATSVGGSWNARFVVATRRWVGFEAAYIGGTNAVNNSLGLDTNNTSRLNRNGVEGALRINAPLYARNTLVSPYVLGGVGWNSYRLSNFNSATMSASFSSATDNTVSVPLAGGLAVGYKGFIADLRYTFRPTYGQSIFLNESSATLTNWDAGAMVGYEF
jgi:hypothetical protein